MDGMVSAQWNYSILIKYLFDQNLTMDCPCTCLLRVDYFKHWWNQYKIHACGLLFTSSILNSLCGISPLSNRWRIFSSNFANHSISKFSHLPHTLFVLTLTLDLFRFITLNTHHWNPQPIQIIGSSPNQL